MQAFWLAFARKANLWALIFSKRLKWAIMVVCGAAAIVSSIAHKRSSVCFAVMMMRFSLFMFSSDKSLLVSHVNSSSCCSDKKQNIGAS